MIKLFKKENLIWNILTISGITILLAGIILCLVLFIGSNKGKVTGTIINISEYRDENDDLQYDIYVSYQIENNRYQSRLDSYSDEYYEGKNLEIYYDKDNPRTITTQIFNPLILIVPGIGLVLVIVGGIGIYIKGKKRVEE